MGQTDILEWLRHQRIDLKNDGYFTAKQIAEGLELQNGEATNIKMIWGGLPALLRFGFIEYRLPDLTKNNLSRWNTMYRYRVKKR